MSKFQKIWKFQVFPNSWTHHINEFTKKNTLHNLRVEPPTIIWWVKPLIGNFIFYMYYYETFWQLNGSRNRVCVDLPIFVLWSLTWILEVSILGKKGATRCILLGFLRMPTLTVPPIFPLGLDDWICWKGNPIKLQLSLVKEALGEHLWRVWF